LAVNWDQAITNRIPRPLILSIYILGRIEWGWRADLEPGNPLRILFIIGTNIFGVYALYKIVQEVYFYLKNQNSDEEF